MWKRYQEITTNQTGTQTTDLCTVRSCHSFTEIQRSNLRLNVTVNPKKSFYFSTAPTNKISKLRIIHEKVHKKIQNINKVFMTKNT